MTPLTLFDRSQNPGDLPLCRRDTGRAQRPAASDPATALYPDFHRGATREASCKLQFDWKFEKQSQLLTLSIGLSSLVSLSLSSAK